MSDVTRFWADPIFRRSVSLLVSLDKEHLAALTNLTRKGFTVSDSDLEQQVGLKEPEATLVLAALRTIYRSRRESGFSGEQSLSEIESLFKSAVDQLPVVEIDDQEREELLKLFAPRPEFDRDNQRQAVQSAPLPVLEDSSFYVDLRAIEEDSSQRGGIRFVPVVLARFFFDEPVPGNLTAFQLTAEGLEELKKSVEKAGRLLKAVEKQSSEWLY